MLTPMLTPSMLGGLVKCRGMVGLYPAWACWVTGMSTCPRRRTGQAPCYPETDSFLLGSWRVCCTVYFVISCSVLLCLCSEYPSDEPGAKSSSPKKPSTPKNGSSSSSSSQGNSSRGSASTSRRMPLRVPQDFTTLEGALRASLDGDRIHVHEGTFPPCTHLVPMLTPCLLGTYVETPTVGSCVEILGVGRVEHIIIQPPSSRGEGEATVRLKKPLRNR